MGVGKLNAAVVDAGPLVHLAEVGCLSLLCVFDVWHVPDAVWSEAVEQGRVSQDDVLRLDAVQRYTLPRAEVERFVQKHPNAHAFYPLW